MPYTAIHDRPPYFGNIPQPNTPRYPPTPRYASPDVDPRSHTGAMPEEGENGNGATRHGQLAVRQSAYQPQRDRDSSSSSSRKRPRQEDEPVHHPGPPRGMPFIYGSFFGVTARNPITRAIGDFLLKTCQGRTDLEVEIKLGQISTPVEPGQRPRRLTMPSMCELVLPYDFRVGPFRADMTKVQHASLNHMLNEATSASAQFVADPSNPSARPPHPIKFVRAKQIDSFYNSAGDSKTRVSRDTATGDVIACIKKRKVADLNVANHLEPLDYRVSVSTEEDCEMPVGNPIFTREKDRACYRHQLVQIDLTFVKQITNGHPVETFEVEIEVVDVPALIAEGIKEERGEASQYDEMLTSILDSARILIRNIAR